MVINTKFTNWGIAYAYENTIELNQKLFNYPQLLGMILQHEFEHIKNPSFLSTIKIELKDFFDFKKHKLMREFTKNNKIASRQSLYPIWIQNSELNFNAYLIFLYSIGLILILSMIII